MKKAPYFNTEMRDATHSPNGDRVGRNSKFKSPYTMWA